VSSLIYAALVIVWAVVLVPMWVRRHDVISESRSVDRFSDALATLKAHDSIGQDGAVTDDEDADVTSNSRPRRDSLADRIPSARVRSAASVPTFGGALPLVWRRRLLIALIALVAFTFLAALHGRISWMVQLLADIALVGFVYLLRRWAVAEAAPAARRRPAMADEDEDAYANGRLAEPASFVRPVMNGRDERANAGAMAHVTVVDAPAESGWMPQRVPLPTYVTAPPAPGVPYREPGDRRPYVPRSGIILDDPADDEEFTDDLDGIIERRRAVGS
jgi:hypothetical protein